MTTNDDLVQQFLPGQELDPFDAVQLNKVLDVCLVSKTLSEAGRTLFSVSRASKKKANDADRLRKYLAKFGLSWKTIQLQ